MINDLKHHFFHNAHHSRQYSLLGSEVQSVILMIISHLILHSILIFKKLIVYEGPFDTVCMYDPSLGQDFTL